MSRNYFCRDFQLILLTRLLISVLLIKPALMYAIRPAEELCTNCTAGCINKSGSCILPKENEDQCLCLNFGSNAIEINMTMEILYLENNAEKNLTEAVTDITITICEFTEGSHDYDTAVNGTECYQKVCNTSANFNYLTKTSNANISISCTRNCSYYDAVFSFEEVRMKPCEVDTDCGEGRNAICINNFCDCEQGYEGEECSELTGCKELKTECDSIGSECIFDDKSPIKATCSCDGGLYFDRQTGKCRTADASDDEKRNLIEYWNSCSICFLKDSASRRLMDDCEDDFEKFRTAFADTAKNTTNKAIKKDEVKLNGGGCSQDKSSSFVLQVESKGKFVLSWAEVQDTIEKMRQDMAYNVSPCNYTIPCLDKAEPSRWMYAMVPLFALFGLLMWAWKQNVFDQNCKYRPEEERKISIPIKPIPSEQNIYVRTQPKQLYSDGARTEALIPSSAQDSRDRETTTVELNNISSSTEPTADTLARFLKSRRSSKPRPSLENLKAELEINKNPKQEGNEREHVYDSVSSEDMAETNL